MISHHRISLSTFLLLLSCKATFLYADEHFSGNNENHEECSAKSIEEETALGLVSMPYRLAVLNGQLPDPNHCDDWCSSPSETTTPCKLNNEITPCEGMWCITTCALWNRFRPSKEAIDRPVSCSMFARIEAYPIGAVPCDESCLIPEIRNDRYPAPTGIGMLCKPGTCYPAAQSRYTNATDHFGRLECPCNWFWSDCTDEFIPIRKIENTGEYGSIRAMSLFVEEDDWHAVVKDHRPGGAIRVMKYNPRDNYPIEAIYALAYYPRVGELQILSSPTDETLDFVARHVADYVRDLPSGPVEKLFVSPSVNGFFNQQYAYLMDYLSENDSIRHVVILATGSGLSGVLSAIETILDAKQTDDDENETTPQLHLFYGVRELSHLPYRSRIHHLVSTESVDMALILTNDEEENSSLAELETGIASALRRSDSIRSLLPSSSYDYQNNKSSKMYPQHAASLDLTSSNGMLRNSGANFTNSVFVICGRVGLMKESVTILETLCKENIDEYDNNCLDFKSKQIFMNI